jgi:predicted anti-sigma-YlaC factor YlaD
MTCAQLNDRLTDLTEGSLPSDVCEEVNRHLAECTDCQLLRQDLEDLARLCRETAAPTTMPDDVKQRIQALLAAPPDPRPSSV